ncbi:hypothetical protein Cyast_1872 [Cyanobacterium stanieri PCC 7202]|uniref:Uncharacterized protein n=1 Tax=Cyanobacterium stanieri (strain ATCC 29140 / PCC 7202) TaxID=292563 RepID=K9YMY7_CYASC|nr:hypothetical protein Cyast_1872 [Cyanobacterium stanieri PCC 7202]
MNNPHNVPDKYKSMDWYAIACKVRAKYEKLKENNHNLEKSLLGYQKEIEVKERVIYEQNQELEVFQENVNKLYHQIEEDKAKIREQKLLMEKLAQELKDSQIQRGALERECSLLQENYNQLQYQIKEKEKENKELNIRLQRQQRSTLEYKAALDQYLESPVAQKPKIIQSDKTTIKSWSEVTNPKNSSEQTNINQLSNFAIAPVPNFVNIPLVNEDKKKVEKEEIKPSQELEKKEEKPLDNEIKEEEINEKKKQENIQKKIKTINLLSDIKPSKDESNKNKEDQKIIIDLPDFFKNKREE